MNISRTPSSPQSGRLRIALIGTGSMGRKYAQMITENKVRGLTLTAAVCRSDDAYRWGRSLGGFEIFRSADELFAVPDSFDAVLIVTPHKSHAELALRAFSCGKHVMCDKPAGINVREAQSMRAAAEKSALVYALMFHNRLRPEYAALKGMISRNEFGTIHRAQMISTRYFRTRAYHSSSPWRSTLAGEGGGALLNQGQHILDIWQWLFGLPEELQAMVMRGKYNDFDVEDEASILMKYSGGMTGSFFISTAEGAVEEKLSISGSRKSAVLENGVLRVTEFSEDTDSYRRRASCNAREELDSKTETIEFEGVRDRELYIKMLQNFTDAVLSGETPVAPGSEGAGALALTEGAYKSEDCGGRIRIQDMFGEEEK